MKTWGLLLFQLPLLLLLLTAATATPSTTCQAQCGNITIPYPFGIGPPGCFRTGFNLTCNQSFTTVPKLYLGDGTVEVLDISLTQGQIRINNSIATSYCTPEETPLHFKIITWNGIGNNGPYTFSEARNTFTTIGCSALASVFSNTAYVINNTNNTDMNYDSSDAVCASVCYNKSAIPDDGSCSGIGCCRTSIGKGVHSLGVSIVSLQNQIPAIDVGPCTKAFLVDHEWFRFDPAHLTDDFYGANSRVPVVLDWAIFSDNGSWTSCEEASNLTSFACRSENSNCYNARNGVGYRCNCSHGFEGNPYLPGGCQDINECDLPDTYPCLGICLNTVGGYSCFCPPGTNSTHDGDPRYHRCYPNKDGSTAPLRIIIIIGAGAGVGLLILFVSSFLLYRRLKQRSIKKHREKCFRRNRGLLLQQLITSSDDDAEWTKIFTFEELQKATNNFDITRILGRGGHGTVYKGILSDQRVVAIKKSEITVQSEIEQFINEVAILSQINHRNVVKLFGCCLETEVPLLVYEFISGGTLSDHLHVVGNLVSSLSFEDRLRIAVEVAGALAYLHSAASISIFHRDVKSSNILLDHNYTAKVSDFGASRSIPLDKTRITTAVQGTFGYLDPEYYHTGQLTEKSDVYSFGVILVELLTGERAISHTLLKEEKSLVMHFIWSLRENRLFQILDARIAEEGRKEELEAIAKLAEVCLRLKGEERPTMKKVEQRLDRLRKTKKQKHINGAMQERNCEETESFITNALRGRNTNDGTRLYSLEKEFMLSLNNPR